MTQDPSQPASRPVQSQHARSSDWNDGNNPYAGGDMKQYYERPKQVVVDEGCIRPEAVRPGKDFELCCEQQRPEQPVKQFQRNNDNLWLNDKEEPEAQPRRDNYQYRNNIYQEFEKSPTKADRLKEIQRVRQEKLEAQQLPEMTCAQLVAELVKMEDDVDKLKLVQRVRLTDFEENHRMVVELFKNKRTKDQLYVIQDQHNL